MKSIMLILAVVLLATTAAAQPGDTANSVGIYFDEAGTVTGWDTPGEGTVYVLLTNPDLAGDLWAWDLAIEVDNGLEVGYVGNFALPASAPDEAFLLHSGNDYACAYAEPQPITGETYVLMEAPFGWFGDPDNEEYACFRVFPPEVNPSIPGHVALMAEDESLVPAFLPGGGLYTSWIAHPYCSEATGTLAGVVRAEGAPLAGVTVNCLDQYGETTFSVETDETGAYASPTDFPSGPYTVAVDHFGYETYEHSVVIGLGPSYFDIDLTLLPTGTLSGVVSALGAPLADVIVACHDAAGDLLFAADTDETGAYTFATPLPVGQYGLVIEQMPYELFEQTILIAAGANIVDVALTPLDIGTVSGVVTSGGTALEGIVVRFLDTADEVAFEDVTDVAGSYASPGYIAMGDYTIVVTEFGYLDFELPVFVDFDTNVFDIELAPAPTGVLTGLVTSELNGDPVTATIRIFAGDTGEQLAEYVCGPDGRYLTDPMPYLTYEVRALAPAFTPAVQIVEIAQPETVLDFTLEPAAGFFLLVDDSGSGLMTAPLRTNGKGNDQIPPAILTATATRSAGQMQADLATMDFYAEIVPAATAHTVDFWDYDAVIYSCSNNLDPLQNTDLKAALLAFSDAGGHLLLEGGDLGFTQRLDGVFMNRVLRMWFWRNEGTGDIGIAAPEAHILNHPNAVTLPITLTYAGYGDGDVLAPLQTAAMPMNWTGAPVGASVITYDSNPAPEGGQTVFFSWNYVAADEGRRDLLENAMDWLMQVETPSCSIAGTALLTSSIDHSGITVSASPNGGSVVTGPDGAYAFPDLYHGTYTIRAVKDGWSTEVTEVTLVENEHMTGVDFVLSPTIGEEYCEEPYLPITDLATTVSEMYVWESGEITNVRVLVDITHTYIGDLWVTLVSPGGTEAILHAASGGALDDLIGVYPTTLTPFESLDALVGEDVFGIWQLQIYDSANADEGTLNRWCLELEHDGGIIPVGVQPLEIDTTGGMNLSWRYDTALFAGFNLYRRTETAPRIRLNDVLLSSPDGRIAFSDDGAGLSQGQKVFYSYAIVRGGVEVAFGDEVEATFSAGLPRVFALNDNYPNPFNPSTTISFDLARSEHVRLSVYDITGRLVKTLVDETRSAATHSAVWDGTDNHGGRVASGTYYYKLEAESYRATKKMMLLK